MESDGPVIPRSHRGRLQALETFHCYVSNVLQTSNQTLNMDGTYTYNNEGKMTSVNYPTTYSFNGADSPEIDHSFSSETDHHSPVVDQRGRSEATLAS